MRAAVIDERGQPLRVRQMPVPEIGPQDVLVEIQASGICFTDLKIAEGLVPRVPTVPGHEPVGVVVDIGSKVSGVEPGDRVGVHAFFACGECRLCRLGEEEACELGFLALAGLGVDGGYAQYMKAPHGHVIPLGPAMDFADAAPLFCAGLTSYAGLRNGGIEPGHKVVVIGVGGLGHLAISIGSALGAEVYAVTTSPDKEAVARQRGAVSVGDAATIAEQLAGSGGANVVLNTADALDPLAALLPGIAKQAAIVLAAGAGSALPITPGDFSRLQLRVVGTFFGSRQDMRELLVLAQEFDIRPQIERFSLDEVNSAHDRLRSNSIRYRAVLDRF